MWWLHSFTVFYNLGVMLLLMLLSFTLLFYLNLCQTNWDIGIFPEAFENQSCIYDCIRSLETPKILIVLPVVASLLSNVVLPLPAAGGGGFSPSLCCPTAERHLHSVFFKSCWERETGDCAQRVVRLGTLWSLLHPYKFWYPMQHLWLHLGVSSPRYM